MNGGGQMQQNSFLKDVDYMGLPKKLHYGFYI